MAIQAAEAGCHLLIEKPLSTNFLLIEDLRKIVFERQLAAQVGYTFRHYPSVAKVKDGIEHGRWGRPLQLTILSGQHFPTHRPNYRNIYYARHETGGGAIQDGTHRALSNGIKTDDVFDIIKTLRDEFDTKVIIMTYQNKIMSYGEESFLSKCVESKVAGIICVDWPWPLLSLIHI